MAERSIPPGAIRSLAELEHVAHDRTSPNVWDYIEGGSGEERTLRANLDAFRRRTLWPRALSGIASIDLATRMLGDPVRLPVFVAPTAYQGYIHADGERATAAAAQSAGVLSVFSTLSSASLEQIAEANGAGRRWFQLYLQPNFDQSAELVGRAERAGYSAIVLTVDVPLLGVRDRQARHGFALDEPVPLGNGPNVVAPGRAPYVDGGHFTLPPSGSADWSVVDRLRSVTSLPIVVKGVLRREDARAAVERGASAVVVSNHGGRQLDAAPASLDALPGVVEEVGARAEVYLDGGVRRASDVAIALALGARAVGVGRPVLWALAVAGRAGVERYLELLRDELANTFAQLGLPSVAAIDASWVTGPA